MPLCPCVNTKLTAQLWPFYECGRHLSVAHFASINPLFLSIIFLTLFVLSTSPTRVHLKQIFWMHDELCRVAAQSQLPSSFRTDGQLLYLHATAAQSYFTGTCFIYYLPWKTLPRLNTHTHTFEKSILWCGWSTNFEGFVFEKSNKSKFKYLNKTSAVLSRIATFYDYCSRKITPPVNATGGCWWMWEDEAKPQWSGDRSSRSQALDPARPTHIFPHFISPQPPYSQPELLR